MVESWALPWVIATRCNLRGLCTHVCQTGMVAAGDRRVLATDRKAGETRRMCGEICPGGAGAPLRYANDPPGRRWQGALMPFPCGGRSA